MDNIVGRVNPLSTYPMVRLGLLNESVEEFNIPAVVDAGHIREIILQKHDE